MSKQEQGKNLNHDISEAPEAKQAGNLSDEDLERVSGGFLKYEMKEVIVSSVCVGKNLDADKA